MCLKTVTKNSVSWTNLLSHFRKESLNAPENFLIFNCNFLVVIVACSQNFEGALFCFDGIQLYFPELYYFRKIATFM